MSKLQTKFIADNAVTEDKINSSAVGNGLAGGAGTPLSVDADSTGGANLATVVAVSANGVAAKIDDTTVGENGSNQLEVKDNSINAAKTDETDNFTWTGAHSYTGGTVTVATPTQSAHATTKSYVDSLRNGLIVKDNVRAVAVTNQTISGLPSTIDGVTTWLADHRILLTGQTTDSQNGIWLVQVSSWTRPTDFAIGDGASGARIFVDEGSSYQDTVWECTTNEGVDVIDTNDLAFTQRPVGETITAGTGLVKSGTTIHIGAATTGNINGIARTSDDISAAVDDTTLELSSNLIQVKALGVDTAQLAATSVTAAKLGSDIAGNGLGGGNGSAIDVDIPNTTTESTVANDDEILIYDTSGTALRSMTRGNFLAGVGTGETLATEAHLITSGETTAGYFTLSNTPVGATNVSASIHTGISQLNKQIVGATGATPDFDILNSNQFHFNNTGAATGLSEDMTTGDVIIVVYSY